MALGCACSRMQGSGWVKFGVDPLPQSLSHQWARVEERESKEMNDGKLLSNAKLLRSQQTEAEKRLWYHLRARRFMDLKFKRQKPLGNYIVDFICDEKRLVIEVDGGQHAEQLGYDQRRDAWLRGEGYTVLRFWNNDVMQQLDAVLEQIRIMITLSPTLSHQWERVGERVIFKLAVIKKATQAGRLFTGVRLLDGCFAALLSNGFLHQLLLHMLGQIGFNFIK